MAHGTPAERLKPGMAVTGITVTGTEVTKNSISPILTSYSDSLLNHRNSTNSAIRP